MPRSSEELLRRVAAPLRLERERGFRDQAVHGGMRRFIERMVQDLLAADPTLPAEELRQLQAAFAHYPRLSRARREALIAGAERLFQALQEGRPLPDLPAPADTADAPSPPVHWDDPVTALRGVAAARAQLLAALGIHTIGDLLSHYPARYQDRRRVLSLAELQHGQAAVVRVEVLAPGRVRRRGAGSVVRVPVRDGQRVGELIWFNQSYRAGSYPPGTQLLVVGTARVEGGKVAVVVTECEPADSQDGRDVGCIVPIYPATEGLSQRLLRRLVEQALERCELPPDPLPEQLRARRGLMPLAQALREAHFPSAEQTRQQARHRLAYQELFALQLNLAQRRRLVRRAASAAALHAPEAVAQLRSTLPFELTGAQQRVIAEVLADLAAPEPAHRLIHGEVGSGKTVVAAAALLVAARAGVQGAVMAPTELLAEQHHATLTELLGPLGIQPLLLTGSIAPEARRRVCAALAAGSHPCAVGTHALFSAGVHFRRLGLVIVDEQHRFGVRQRARLALKGDRPNVLVMSATPIPRTLALTAYGDFDVSTLDELPPGRRRPRTLLLAREQRAQAWELVRAQVAQGRQAYWVCPRIEQSPEQEVAAAQATFAELTTGPLRGLRLGLVHGRMPADERQATMQAFRTGTVQVLVATNLIEVGVDVPNASVIVIESAERFGLAQLHQLRGRVSRCRHQPHCVLVAGECGPDAFERLAIMVRTHDGFAIAEEDLRTRGPGELAGLRQHGWTGTGFPSALSDTLALAHARADAFALVDSDPHLTAPEHEALATLVRRPDRDDIWAL